MSSPIPWKIERIENLAADIPRAVVGGPFGSDLVSSDYVDSGIPVIRGTNLPFGKRFSIENLAFVSEGKADQLAPNTARPNDIVFTQRGTLGQVGIVPQDAGYDRFIVSQSQMKLTVDVDKADPVYLFYYFTLPSTVRYIENHALQSGVPHINLGILKRFEVPVPELAVQQKIAAILTAYDDLIENNRQRIALLEKMAEEIYREWFVRLRFPGHEHTPVHKGVPEGWAIKFGDDLFETVKGRSYSSEDISDSQTGHDAEHPFITLKSINRGGGYRREGLKYYRGRFNANQIVAPGDVVMAVTDMTQNRAIVGQVARVPHLAECVDAIISLDLVCLRPREWSETFLYSFCRYSGFASHLAQFANGANVLHLKPSVIGSQKLLAPPAELSQKFDSIVEPIHQLLDSLSEQSGELTAARDLLLNRLISGKLRVDDLDIQFPPSMQAEAA